MNKKRQILISLVTIVIILFIIFVTREYMNPSRVLGTPDGEDLIFKQWLSGDTCPLPCWAGVIPGKTTLVQAISELENNPSVIEVNYSETDTGGELLWTYSDGRSGKALSRLLPSGDNVIYVIFPRFNWVSLEYIENFWGSPTHAWVKRIDYGKDAIPSVGYSISLIWLDKGVSVIGGTPKESEYRITEDFIVKSFALFDPTLEGYLAYKGNAGKHLLPWHGYDDFDAYLINP
jgi:hypothetical protein